MYKNYNMNQLVLPLDLEVKLHEKDIAYTVHHLVESIPSEAFTSFLRHTGCPAYPPRMMLKLILCAYTQSVFSGRKMEANANKFTFVWRKAVEKHHARLIEQSNALYNELLEANIMPEIEKESEDELSVKELVKLTEQLEKVVNRYSEQIEQSTEGTLRKQIRGERKTPKQQLKQVREWLVRKQKYRQDEVTFGQRNSYSKTDYDATFMRMKDDYMKNGQLKPGYNVQVATEGQYTLAYGVYPNPTDTKTLIPFLDEIERDYFELPEHIVADAGYGSEQNYEDILTKRQRTPLITHAHSLHEQKKKTKTNPFHTSNWVYNVSEDSYTCPNNKKVAFVRHTFRKDKTGFQRNFKLYECEDCTDCPFRLDCTKAEAGVNRKLMVNER